MVHLVHRGEYMFAVLNKSSSDLSMHRFRYPGLAGVPGLPGPPGMLQFDIIYPWESHTL